MSYEQETIKVISHWDGLELDLLVLVPEETPKGIFQIHHGMLEYKERYLPFMAKLYLATEKWAPTKNPSSLLLRNQ